MCGFSRANTVLFFIKENYYYHCPFTTKQKFRVPENSIFSSFYLFKYKKLNSINIKQKLDYWKNILSFVPVFLFSLPEKCWQFAGSKSWLNLICFFSVFFWFSSTHTSSKHKRSFDACSNNSSKIIGASFPSFRIVQFCLKKFVNVFVVFIEIQKLVCLKLNKKLFLTKKKFTKSDNYFKKFF